MAIPENFAGHPKSIAELRADKTSNASQWTPRDMLIAVLRDIDEGRCEPETMIIAWTDTKDQKPGLPGLWWQNCSKGIFPVLGLLTRVTHRINAIYDEGMEADER